MMNYQRKAGNILFKKIDNEYHLLLVKQWNSIWSLPKGTIDPGETPKRAAQRELQEETGIYFILDTFVNEAMLYYQKFYLFNCNDLEIDFKINGDEITEIKWVPIGDLTDTNVNSYLKRLYFKKEYFISLFNNIE